MRVTLISLHPEVLSVGPRSLSACLKQAGHEVDLIFLPEDDFHRSRGRRYESDYSPAVLDSLVDLCQGSDLVGISLLTNYFLRAVTITEILDARLDVPIVWGGPHPTAQPEECLKYADMVCLGEGEEALVDLAERVSTGQSVDRIPNIWLRQGKEIVRNHPRPLIQELDSLPLSDCDLLGQYILDEEKFHTLDADLLQRYAIFRAPDRSGVTYLVISSRGCPHSCSYCANDMWRRMYTGQRYVRRRSVENICDELEYAIERIPGITAVNFADDNFAAIGVKQMRNLLETYASRVGLPFSCTLSPVFANDERLDILIRAGAFRISMGIQSASERVLEMYERRVSNEVVRDAVKRLEKAWPLMREPRIINYHLIVDNPYESPEDTIATLRFVLDLPRRESALCFSLVPFPGTAMYDMMRKDGLIVDEYSQVYTKDFTDHQSRFTKYWLYLFYGGMPVPVLQVLLKPALMRLVDCGKPKWLFRIIHWSLRKGYRFFDQVGQLMRRFVPCRS